MSEHLDTNTVYLLLGGNIGDRLKQLDIAKEFITKYIGGITSNSLIYQTEAWGLMDQPTFLNQVIVVKTILNPAECMTQIFFIEKTMGRIRTIKNAERIIDIDILFYNQEIILLDSLIVPHPEIQNRRFVLVPLQEIAENFIHPGLKTSISILLDKCTDQLAVIPYHAPDLIL